MSLKDTPPKKAAVICKKKNAKMTVETVETVVAAAPYAALIGHKLRPLLSDSQSALADCEQDVIQIRRLLSRNGKLSLVRLTKSFPTIPNLRGIANANQNDQRFKMWSVMLLCTIQSRHPSNHLTQLHRSRAKTTLNWIDRSSNRMMNLWSVQLECAHVYTPTSVGLRPFSTRQ